LGDIWKKAVPGQRKRKRINKFFGTKSKRRNSIPDSSDFEWESL
jgi:hypothetical protein